MIERTHSAGNLPVHRAGLALAASALLCLSATGVNAQERTQEPTGASTNSGTNLLLSSPFSLVPGSRLDGAAPAPANDDGRPLVLQLSQPLSLQTFGESILGPAGGTRLAGSQLNYRLDDRLSLQGGMALSESGTFHALGSIHCHNGVLDAVSYRASDCTFVDDGPGQEARRIVIGAGYDVGDNARASINLFQDRARGSGAYQPGLDALAAPQWLDPFRAGLGSGPLPGGFDPLQPGLVSGSRERTGVDVEFQVGFSTDQAGDLVLGLQLTRVLDSGVNGAFYAAPGPQNWNIARPYDTARLSFDWNRGSFSGGIDSYYRSPVDLVGAADLDRQATFDVHFSWRAPWNASLSVGASNLLGAGVDESPVNENPMADPLESIYGRIPYVRYKQDL
ncbi:MAG: hypothetical protein V2I57_14250 [Xanthomonadales bacterium]|jgi:hypothetical protein|nr:hypothetical protein [Xanthomonadales bacterium]